MEREKVVTGNAGENTEGDTVKHDDMPDEKPDYHKYEAERKPDEQERALCRQPAHTMTPFFLLFNAAIAEGTNIAYNIVPSDTRRIAVFLLIAFPLFPHKAACMDFVKRCL